MVDGGTWGTRAALGGAVGGFPVNSGAVERGVADGGAVDSGEASVVPALGMLCRIPLPAAVVVRGSIESSRGAVEESTGTVGGDPEASVKLSLRDVAVLCEIVVDVQLTPVAASSDLAVVSFCTAASVVLKLADSVALPSGASFMTVSSVLEWELLLPAFCDDPSTNEPATIPEPFSPVSPKATIAANDDDPVLRCGACLEKQLLKARTVKHAQATEPSLAAQFSSGATARPLRPIIPPTCALQTIA